MTPECPLLVVLALQAQEAHSRAKNAKEVTAAAVAQAEAALQASLQAATEAEAAINEVLQRLLSLANGDTPF